MEVDALTKKITQVIRERREVKIKYHEPSAKQLIDKRLTSLFKERDALDKKINSELKRLGISHISTSASQDYAIKELATKLSKIKYIHYDEIEIEVILAGDSSADQLIKKISEMFL